MFAPASAVAGTTPAASTGGVFTLPSLGYAFDALEPYIDAQTMEIHYSKHHAAYVEALNKVAATNPTVASRTAEELLKDLSSVPEDVRTKVRNNAGGHVNHSFFWLSLKKGDAPKSGGELAKAIARKWGDQASFYEKFSTAALDTFGSGWAWLSVTPAKELVIESTPNQDNPIMHANKPLLGIDVWEHAYYLKHQNKRKDYVAAFANVINWDVVDKRYDEAVS